MWLIAVVPLCPDFESLLLSSEVSRRSGMLPLRLWISVIFFYLFFIFLRSRVYCNYESSISSISAELTPNGDTGAVLRKTSSLIK
jgi:hypothetical protein